MDMNQLGMDVSLERERRRALAQVIERNRPEIERRWLERVQAAVGRSDVDPHDLRNNIDGYLLRLAEVLRSASPDEASMAPEGTAAWVDIARHHGLTRVRLGFDISQLVEEFIILRRVLFEVSQEQGVMQKDGQANRLADLIEAAIATSVRSYVDSRDYGMRRLQAEHIGFMTHELRNPLTIATMVGAQFSRKPSFPQELRPALDMLNRSLRRMAELISNVLLTEKFESNAIEVRLVHTTLGALMEAILPPARETARMKGVELKAHFNPDLSLHVDPSLTISAAENLLSNAVKFTDSGTVELTVEDQPSETVIHVRDTCVGISDEELSTLFRPFQRGSSDKPGTGLGLAIARRAVEAQGGAMYAESTPNVGCHFWFSLPKTRH
jgi:signal transduction histidine kinase